MPFVRINTTPHTLPGLPLLFHHPNSLLYNASVVCVVKIMALLDCCRLMLFLIEWIWTTVVLGIFPDQLTTTEQLTDGSFEGACLFNMNLGQSRCDFGIAWAAIAFLVLTCTIIWYFLEYCTSARFSTHVETIIFTWLTVWWVRFQNPKSFPSHSCLAVHTWPVGQVWEM